MSMQNSNSQRSRSAQQEWEDEDQEPPLSFRRPLAFSVVRPVPSSNRSAVASSSRSQYLPNPAFRPSISHPTESLLPRADPNIPTPLIAPSVPYPVPPPTFGSQGSGSKSQHRPTPVGRSSLQFSSPNHAPPPPPPFQYNNIPRSHSYEAERRASLAKRVMQASNAALVAERAVHNAESDFEKACQIVGKHAEVLAKAQEELNQVYILWHVRIAKSREVEKEKEEVATEMAGLLVAGGGQSHSGVEAQSHAEATTKASGAGATGESRNDKGKGKEKETEASKENSEPSKRGQPRRSQRAQSSEGAGIVVGDGDQVANPSTAALLTPQPPTTTRKRTRASLAAAEVNAPSAATGISAATSSALGQQVGSEETNVEQSESVAQLGRGKRRKQTT
ncbi:hypothetical protein CF326_g2294 [Tilletia indica]|nr:hypothetical protein CF326_g2294 [Tilletia indica]